ncbi:hypothetical protein QLQ12_14165 [Actinoplanes sp. NEAU-A12]|uniref:Thioester domain-containing protein n=1 Tax=Actinoplanes sandaracinus TaxID=3045177 RepID=A0ABT6WJ46_9ACTN|nr:hypothetical protein [Actinoplanes sandaracinus]MDI6099744.1 hypothetical protein [Actinoplanes sandaracinus]
MKVGPPTIRFSAVAAVAVLTIGPGASANGDESNSSQFTARLQKEPIFQLENAVGAAGRKPVSADPAYIYMNSQDVVKAFSLDMSKTLPFDRSWKGILSDRIKLRGIAAAQWIAREQYDTGALPSVAEEDRARQVAIWHFTNDLAIVPDLARSAPVLARAQELIRLATDRSGGMTTGLDRLSIDVSVLDANAEQVSIEIRLDSGSEKLTNWQTLELDISGDTLEIETGDTTDIHQDKYDAGDAVGEITTNLDQNTAVARLDRMANTMRVGIEWEPSVYAGMILIPDGNAAPLVTAETAELRYVTAITLDPKGFPGPQDLVDRFLMETVGRLPNWLAPLAILVLLYLIPKFSALVDIGFTHLKRACRALYRRRVKAASIDDRQANQPQGKSSTNRRGKQQGTR